MKSMQTVCADTRVLQPGYDRLLRRLDQALDIAHTRQWLLGQSQLPAELEVQGLSRADLCLLQQVLCRLGSCSASWLSLPQQAEQQYAADQAGQWPDTPA